MILQVITYSFALWFGLYLLRQRFYKPGMRYTGLGLLAYALGLAIDILLSAAVSPVNAAILRQERVVLAILTAACWFAAIRHLFPRSARLSLPRFPLRVVLVGSIFFGLSVAMLLLPQAWFSSDLVVLAVGLDLAVLSYGIASLDAFEEGEALPRDFLRSLGAALLVGLLFGGQVALAMVISNNWSSTMRLLLLAVISSAVFLQTFSDPVQSLLDGLMFAAWPNMRRERENLRAVASALPRVDDSLNLTSISDEEFTRLTRRALGYMGDLKRLASSPLTRLPVITRRLAARGLPDSTLERAAELKLLLSESIERLKPRGSGRDSGGFGITDEWRYYNALYYPYVLGIKPFSQRLTSDSGDDGLSAVLDWFRGQVPERTLHNWQNTAAGLVASDLREREKFAKKGD